MTYVKPNVRLELAVSFSISSLSRKETGRYISLEYECLWSDKKQILFNYDQIKQEVKHIVIDGMMHQKRPTSVN